MPSDTPTDRAALEALADKLERAHVEYSDGFPCGFGPPINPDGPEAAATLRTLASRAEPPADVAALVKEARALQDEWADRTYISSDLAARASVIDTVTIVISCDRLHSSNRRLAAALTAQAERADRAEALLREARAVLEPFAEAANKADAKAKMLADEGMHSGQMTPGTRTAWGITYAFVAAARALADKIRERMDG